MSGEYDRIGGGTVLFHIIVISYYHQGMRLTYHCVGKYSSFGGSIAIDRIGNRSPDLMQKFTKLLLLLLLTVVRVAFLPFIIRVVVLRTCCRDVPGRDR